MIAAVLVVGTAACVEEKEIQPQSPDQIGTHHGWLAGDFGPLAGVAGQAEVSIVRDNATHTSLITISRHEGDPDDLQTPVATHLIFLDKFPEDFERGRHNVLYDPYGAPAAIQLNTCSGSDRDGMTYDDIAEEVSLTVANTAEGRMLTFDARTFYQQPAVPQGVDNGDTGDPDQHTIGQLMLVPD